MLEIIRDTDSRFCSCSLTVTVNTANVFNLNVHNISKCMQ